MGWRESRHSRLTVISSTSLYIRLYYALPDLISSFCSVVLLDLSMPVLDGVGASAQMREIESKRRQDENAPRSQPTCILALTGMSSLEDKRRAFEAGVDG